MAKRSWQEANLPSPNGMSAPGVNQSMSMASPALSYHSGHSATYSDSPQRIRSSEEASKSDRKPQRSESTSEHRLPSISRKVKACAACRKQKIKCIMTGEPPCQRCKERGLSCRLNKSLQTLMSEDSRWKSSVTRDISSLYGSLEAVLSTLNLPPLPALQVSSQEPAVFFDPDEGAKDDEDEDQSYDNSPKVSPVTEHLSHVPIESLYQITGLRSLRAADGVTEDQKRICKQLRDSDFISRGVIKREDAEYLADFYLTKLDAYVWHLAGDYKDLESFRQRSPTLTACILTIAALHETTKTNLYSICSKEYRRLVANAMFERRIDVEYLRALVIGSYWLSDISWTLSGYAIRRASEFHLRTCYHQVAESIREPNKYTHTQLENAMDGIRVLYMLYICDHHLSILYGRSSIMRDNESYISGWNNYLACSLATDADKRICSQVNLVFLMNSIRESLGPEDDVSVLPVSAVSTIHKFESDLDDWVARFSQHNPSRYVGNWPSKGVVMHYHFAKLYLDSYVFRGLPETKAVIPEHFLEIASAAVSGATSIINLLLEDRDLQAGLARVPHYFHGMIAFACMFLLKVATKHNEQLFVDTARFGMLVAGLARLLRVTDVGKEHLVHRMAEGLEKMVEMLGGKSRSKRHVKDDTTSGKNVAFAGSREARPPVTLNSKGQPVPPDMDGLDPNGWDFGDSALGLGMPFFDFEGTSLGGEQNMYPFPM